MKDPSDKNVSAALKEAGLDATLVEAGMWTANFSINGTTKTTFLMRGKAFIVLAFIRSKKLKGKPVDSLPRETLAVLLRESARSELAKVEYFAGADGETEYVTTSSCLVDESSGKTIKKRMRAAAKLAVAVAKALRELEDD